MARARSIRNYTDSELVNLMSDDAERTFARLLTVADRDGNLFAHPTKLNKLLFPLKTYRDFQISTWIKELATEHIIPPSKKPTALLHLYEVNGKSYLHINKYGQTHKGEKPIYPPPPEGEAEEEDELEPEGKTEGEENCRASSFLKSVNTEQPKQQIQKSSKEIELRARTVENEQWIKDTARIQIKSIMQVKSFCERWIQKKVHLKEVGIDHPKATVENLIKFMFEDLEKEKSAPLPQQPYIPPAETIYSEKQIKDAEKIVFKRVASEYNEYKKTGKLNMLSNRQTIEILRKVGLNIYSKKTEDEYFEIAKLLVIGANGNSIKPGFYTEFRKLSNLRTALTNGTLNNQQIIEIKSIGERIAIGDFYERQTVDEFEELVGFCSRG